MTTVLNIKREQKGKHSNLLQISQYFYQLWQRPSLAAYMKLGEWIWYALSDEKFLETVPPIWAQVNENKNKINGQKESKLLELFQQTWWRPQGWGLSWSWYSGYILTQNTHKEGRTNFNSGKFKVKLQSLCTQKVYYYLCVVIRCYFVPISNKVPYQASQSQCSFVTQLWFVPVQRHMILLLHTEDPLLRLTNKEQNFISILPDASTFPKKRLCTITQNFPNIILAYGTQ